MDAARLELSHGLAGALSDESPFELGHRANDSRRHLACGGRRVDTEVETYQ